MLGPMLRRLAPIILFISCSTASPERLQEEALKIQRELLTLLRDVESPTDIQKIGPSLRELSFDLVHLIEKTDSAGLEPSHQTQSLSDALKKELERIYKMKGGRALIEKYQREALIELDSYSKKGDQYSL